LSLTTFARTWSVLATQSGFGILKLRLSEHGTEGRGCSLWRTPEAGDSADRTFALNSRGEPKLSAQVKLWRTPKADDPNHGPASEAGILRRVAKGQSIRLQDQVNHPVLFRTPDAGCARGAQSKERFAESLEKHRLLTLNDQVAHLWPTPTSHEFAGMNQSGDGRERPNKLAWSVKLFPTPRASDADKGTRSLEGSLKELNRPEFSGEL
jgi:hypothetical protein